MERFSSPIFFSLSTYLNRVPKKWESIRQRMIDQLSKYLDRRDWEFRIVSLERIIPSSFLRVDSSEFLPGDGFTFLWENKNEGQTPTIWNIFFRVQKCKWFLVQFWQRVVDLIFYLLLLKKVNVFVFAVKSLFWKFAKDQADKNYLSWERNERRLELSLFEQLFLSLSLSNPTFFPSPREAKNNKIWRARRTEK